MVFLHCGNPDSKHAGTSTETTNGITVAVVDTMGFRVSGARVVAYSARTFRAIDTAFTQENGIAELTVQTEDSICQIEVIAGEDSAAMAWIQSHGDLAPVLVRAAASLILRTGLPLDSIKHIPTTLFLQGTPYRGNMIRSEYRFGRLPAGLFQIVNSQDSAIATTQLQAGAVTDTLVFLGSPAMELVWEDFNDGDNKHRYASQTHSQGWYLNVDADARWISPESTSVLPSAITSVGAWNGKSMSMRFDVGSNGSLILGTHIGADSNLYDFSKLSAIRMMARGDAKFSFALEQSQEPVPGKFNKALWSAQATGEWREIVLHPGEEIIEESVYQFPASDVADSVALVSFFIRTGTWLEIDDITFEGIDESALVPVR